MKYTACFKGREVGAIGTFNWHNVDIEAEDTKAAEIKLYDTHEHISKLFFLWPSKQTVCSHDAGHHSGCDVYVSTYNGETWKQTDCNRSDIERVKAEHLADDRFMSRYQ